jgi:hypothetical protein
MPCSASSCSGRKIGLLPVRGKKTLAEGETAQVLKDPRVIAAYSSTAAPVT